MDESEIAIRRVSWYRSSVFFTVGAETLFGVVHETPHNSRHPIGFGADGYGNRSIVGLNATGAFVLEIIVTFIFVFVVLAVTHRAANAGVAGLVIGLCLTFVHLVGISLDGTSVNPARSFRPALFVGGERFSQLWGFTVAPLIGETLSAIVYLFLHPITSKT
jgi:aquaporin Z